MKQKKKRVMERMGEGKSIYLKPFTDVKFRLCNKSFQQYQVFESTYISFSL